MLQAISEKKTTHMVDNRTHLEDANHQLAMEEGNATVTKRITAAMALTSRARHFRSRMRAKRVLWWQTPGWISETACC